MFSVNNDHMRFLTSNTSVVTVGVDSETTQSLSKTFGEGVSNQTITGLEARSSVGRSSLRQHEPSGGEHKDNRTDQRHKGKYPYNRQRNTDYRKR